MSQENFQKLKNNLKDSLQNKLFKREQEGTLRSLSSLEGFVDFYSNDYLGFSKIKTNQIYFGGSTGSRLISGTTDYSLKVEAFLAKHFESESALVFNSGYDANLGLLSSLLLRSDYVLFDEYIHASVRDGIRLSLGKSISFKHNDLNDLEQKLAKLPQGVYVAVETLYSMDGDFSPIQDIVRICKKFNAYLIVDEAHSGGVFGEFGKGYCVERNIQNEIFARVVTFGKAYGAHGAVVLGNYDLINYLINFARSFIYTTALPLDSFERIYNSVSSYEEIEINKKILFENIEYFRLNLKSYNSTSDELSPIQIIRIPKIDVLKNVVSKMQNENLAVKPIFSPTVPIGMEGLRICIHSFNTRQQLDKLLTVLNSL